MDPRGKFQVKVKHWWEQKFNFLNSSYFVMYCFNFITDFQETTLALDFRVTVLEENGGDDGNSSVAELEVRVETLEGTAADDETRISTAESDINGYCFHRSY